MSLLEFIRSRRATNGDALDWSGLVYPPEAEDPTRPRCIYGMMLTVQADGAEHHVPVQCAMVAAHDDDEHGGERFAGAVPRSLRASMRTWTVRFGAGDGEAGRRRDMSDPKHKAGDVAVVIGVAAAVLYLIAMVAGAGWRAM